jgi:hypothetical protein
MQEFHFPRWFMKWLAVLSFAVLSLLLPTRGSAQSVGRIECPRTGGFVYLYSSMTTLDVRTTLQCGEQVQITGRYDQYFGVRTAKGEIGYVPQASIGLLKDTTGPRAPLQVPAPVTRERTPYDAPGSTAPAAAAASAASGFVLRNGTQIRLQLRQTISSATAKVGDHVEMEVVEDVIVDGLCIVAKSAPAVGTVSEAETKKRLGHNGTLGISLSWVLLADNTKAPIRGYQQAQGATATSSVGITLSSGKDVSFVQGTEFTALVDGDVRLNADGFSAARPADAATPQGNPKQ